MKVLLIAAVAVVISGAAFAKDLKGRVMTDSEMDKVTAGAGFGIITATPVSNGHAQNGLLNGISGNPGNGHPPGFVPSMGVCTANRPTC